MRLFITAELRRDPAPLTLNASGDNLEKPLGRLIAANIDLKTIIAVLSVAGALIGMHIDTATKLATMQHDKETQAVEIRINQEKISRLNIRVTEDSLTKSQYEHDTRQQDLLFGSLTSNQQQLYTMLLQQTACPASHLPYNPHSLDLR